MKKTIIAAVAGAALLLTSQVASAQVCAIGIFISAAVVSAKEKRELTSEEAMSCGITTLFEKPKEPAKKKTKVARQQKTAKPQ